MKTYFMLSAALIVGIAGSAAQAANGSLKVVKTSRLGTPQTQSVPSLNATPFYSDITTFSGSGMTFGGTLPAQTQPSGGTGLLTTMACDDVTVAAGPASGTYTLNEVSFSIANFDTVGLDAATTLFFYLPDGRNGGPGTLIDGVVFSPFGIADLIPAGSVQLISADLSTLTPPITFALSATGTATVWACAMYDDDNGTVVIDAAGTHISQAQMDNLGFGLCSPPTVGSSTDKLYNSNAPVLTPFGNPAGTQFNFGGTPVANACLELSQ